MSKTVRLEFIEGTKLFDFLNTHKIEPMLINILEQLVSAKKNSLRFILDSSEKE
jgi:hypothetical protein